MATGTDIPGEFPTITDDAPDTPAWIHYVGVVVFLAGLLAAVGMMAAKQDSPASAGDTRANTAE